MRRKLIVSAALFLIWSSENLACELLPGYTEPSISTLIGAATYIVEATYDSKLDNGFYHFSVHRWHKGNGPSSIGVAGFGAGPDCKLSVPKERAILFLSKKTVNGHYCLDDNGPFTGAREVSEHLIDEIKKRTPTK